MTEIKEAMKKADANGDGRLSFTDWMNFNLN